MKTIDPAIQRGLSVDIPSRIVISSSQKEADLDTHKWFIVYDLSWTNIKNIKRHKLWKSWRTFETLEKLRGIDFDTHKGFIADTPS